MYRIIKFEFATQDDMLRQIDKSVRQNAKYHIGIGSTMTVKDRLDDPCEFEFFNNDKIENLPGCMTQEQYEIYKKEKALKGEKSGQ